MTIAVGDKIPDIAVKTPGPEGPVAVGTGDLLGKGKVVLFGLPGAFTPTCSASHLPGFVVKADDIKGKGVDKIVCMSVNDAFVLGSWAESQNAGDIDFLADGSGEFSKALGLEADLTAVGMGVRCKRFAAIIEDGVVTAFNVETGPGLDVSSAESILALL